MTPERVTTPDRHLLLYQIGGAMTLRTGKGSAGGVYRYYTLLDHRQHLDACS